MARFNLEVNVVVLTGDYEHPISSNCLKNKTGVVRNYDSHNRVGVEFDERSSLVVITSTTSSLRQGGCADRIVLDENITSQGCDTKDLLHGREMRFNSLMNI